MNKQLTECTNLYYNFMAGREPGILEMQEMFYEEVDADQDGNMEIIAAYGEQESVRVSFVLRETEGEIQVVGQNFYEGAYDCDSIEMVRFTGSEQSFIVAGVTNYGNMNGLVIYEITAGDVRCISGSQAASGICYSYLSERQEDGTYSGFITERFGADVFYYAVKTTFQYLDGSFVQLPSEINVGDYPQNPTAVVLQYLSLKCLNQNYYSNHAVERLLEIRDSRFYFYFSLDPMIWGVRIANYAAGVDAEETPGLDIGEHVGEKTALVLVHWSDRQSKEMHQVEFDLVLDGHNWCISDIKETVDIGNGDHYLQFATFDINRTYEGAAGFTELDLRLPRLSGDYRGLALINRFYAEKEAFFYEEMVSSDPLMAEFPSESIKGRMTNHYRSADYCFTAKKGRILSIMAYLDGGSSGSERAGKEGNTFDLVTGQRLSLSDLFRVSEAEYLKVIHTFLERRGTDGGCEAGSPELKPDPDNFYLTDHALVVFYLQPGLNSNGEGRQMMEIPYGEISHILTVDIN